MISAFERLRGLIERERGLHGLMAQAAWEVLPQALAEAALEPESRARALEEAFRRRFLEMLQEAEQLRPETRARFLSWRHSGFSVEATQRLEAGERERAERLARHGPCCITHVFYTYTSRTHIMVRIQVLLSPEEREAFRREASREGLSLSAWLRRAGLDRLAAEERREPFRTPADLDAFFAACDRQEPGREPEWEAHEEVMRRSRRGGESGT